MADVLIYVADGVLYDGLDYGHRIEQRLADAGIATQRFDLTSSAVEMPPPGQPVIFTGGQTSVRSPEPWIHAAVALARDLVARGRPVIGICLGSQILAEALHPESIVSAPAIEVGLTPVTRPDDLSSGHVVPSFHYQAISPEFIKVTGAHVEWRNAHTAVQAYRYGERVFGCQFHPELSAADMHRLIDYHENVIAEHDGDVSSAHRSVAEYQEALSADLFRIMVVDRIVHSL
jgi:GMP synthase-like glutamine amidotransferase